MSTAMPIEDVHSLPVPRTSMVGRELEAGEVSALLLQRDVSLVTVTGPGGVGKTRLAIKVADSLVDSFRDGTCFVSLGPIHNHDLVIPTIAHSLGLRDDGNGIIESRLHDRLRDFEILLVLDNLEQIVDAGPGLVDLLRACPGVKLLVTSRAVLRLSVEYVYPLSGLGVPADARSLPINELLRIDAVRLFVERVKAINPGFELTQSDAAIVIDICRQLDGLPLALELAAPRLRMLSPKALHARLSQRLMLLTGGYRDQPQRHRTIRDAIEWSVQLLSRPEQAVFRRLAVFAGPFTIGAAEAVVAGDDHEQAEDGVEIYESLGSLVDQSLLERLPSVDGEPTFGMLQTIRDFGLEQLRSSEDSDEVSIRHARYFLASAETAARHLTGPDQARWLNDIELVLDDHREAMSFVGNSSEAEMHLRLATALWRFGYTRGHLSEARAWLQGALKHYREPTQLRAEALNAEGLLASLQGDTRAAIPAHEEAMELSRTLGDRRGIAVALNGLGDASAVDGHLDAAYEHYQAALHIFREIGDTRGTAGALTNLGNLHWDKRELDQAVMLHEEALPLYEAIDDRRGIAWSVTNLGTLAVEQRNHAAGAPYLKDALALYRELSDPSGIVTALEGIAEIASAVTNPAVEATLYAAAHAVRERIGTPVAVSSREQYEDEIGRTRQLLGDSFERVWAVGKAMTIDEAIVIALDFLDSPSSRGPDTSAPATASPHGLSRREVEVVRLVAAGRTNAEISDLLSISPRTVTTHLSNVFNKLDLSNRSAVAAFAHREGIV